MLLTNSKIYIEVSAYWFLKFYTSLESVSKELLGASLTFENGEVLEEIHHFEIFLTSNTVRINTVTTNNYRYRLCYQNFVAGASIDRALQEVYKTVSFF